MAYMKNKGFTLIEMLVALGIFAVLLVAVINVFVSGFRYQRRAVEMQTVQREGSYMLETISREIRMATGINPNQRGINSSKISFVNHEGHQVDYCRASQLGTTVTCNDAGDYFAMIDNTVGSADIVNSSDVRVNNMKFYVSNQDFALSQPRITIVLSMRSKRDSSAELTLQSTVSMRLYR